MWQGNAAREYAEEQPRVQQLNYTHGPGPQAFAELQNLATLSPPHPEIVHQLQPFANFVSVISEAFPKKHMSRESDATYGPSPRAFARYQTASRI